MSKDTAATQSRENGKFAKTQKISYDDAVKLAEYVIKGREDYVYDEKYGGHCFNWNEEADRPSCVVGHILFEWGVPKERLIKKNTSDVYEFSDVMERKAAYFLSHLQGNQDAGRPWGESLRLATDKTEKDGLTFSW